jgi:hypothetical protein
MIAAKIIIKIVIINPGLKINKEIDKNSAITIELKIGGNI